LAAGDGPESRQRKALEMDKSSKELIARTDDGNLKVFAHSSPRELTMDDLEVVAGGRRGSWDPNG
jgi:hypothetical protein